MLFVHGGANLLAGTVELTLGRNLSLDQAVEVRDQWRDGHLDVGLSGWIVGGYLSNWVTDALKLPKGFKVVQDILPSSLADKADVLLPSAAWVKMPLAEGRLCGTR